jgi:hypothetical protein
VLSNTNLTSLWCHDNYFTSPDNVVGANRISEPQTYQGDIEYEGGFVYYPQLAEQIANPAINPPINLTLDRQYTGEIDETTETAICFDAFIFPAELTGDTVSGFYIEYSLMPGALSWGEPVRMDSQILITSAMASGQAGYTNFGYKIGALTSGTVYLLRLRMVNASSGEPSSEWSEAIEFTAGRLRILYGDINRDSLVNNYDLILMIRAINFSETAELDAQALDVNGDAAFNELDLTHFLKHFAQPGVTLGPQ